MKKILLSLAVVTLGLLNVNAQVAWKKSTSATSIKLSETPATLVEAIKLDNGGLLEKSKPLGVTPKILNQGIVKSINATTLWKWDFDNDPEGAIEDDFWFFDGDGAAIQPSPFSNRPFGWVMYYEPNQSTDLGVYFNGGTGNYVLYSMAWFTEYTGSADDWVVSPVSSIPATGTYEFAWDAKSVIYNTNAIANGWKDGYEVKVVELGVLNAFFESLPSTATDAQVAAGLANLGQVLFSTDFEVGGIDAQMVSRAVDIPASYAGKNVCILLHGTPNWCGVVVDNIELRSKEAHSLKVELSNLPKIGFYQEPTWLKPHSEYTSKPNVKVTSIGSQAVTNVVATLEQFDLNNYNLTATDDVNFGTLNPTDSKTLPTTKNFTLTAEKGSYFSLTVNATQSEAQVQIDSEDFIVTLTESSFAQDNEVLDSYYYINDGTTDAFAGLEYVFPLDLKMKSVSFLVSENSEMTNATVYVFDGETSELLGESSSVTLSLGNWNEAQFADGFELTANHSYIIAVKEEKGKKLLLAFATNHTPENRGRIASEDVPTSEDWFGNTFTPMVRVTVEKPNVGFTTPVKEVIKVVREGNDYVLTYPSSATSVAVYNIAGQKVGEYKLNASGSYRLSTSNLVNGAYTLKFNGSNVVAKILK
jgi:hypothetical protein